MTYLQWHLHQSSAHNGLVTKWRLIICRTQGDREKGANLASGRCYLSHLQEISGKKRGWNPVNIEISVSLFQTKNRDLKKKKYINTMEWMYSITEPLHRRVVNLVEMSNFYGGDDDWIYIVSPKPLKPVSSKFDGRWSFGCPPKKRSLLGKLS